MITTTHIATLLIDAGYSCLERPSNNLEKRDHQVFIAPHFRVHIGGNYLYLVNAKTQSKEPILSKDALIPMLEKVHKLKGINGYSVMKKSKYSYGAWTVDSKKPIFTAPSLPKLEAKFPSQEKTKARKTKKPKTTSIKTLVIDYIVSGLEDAEIIKLVKEKHPGSAFDNRHISWYRSTLFRDKIIGAEFAPRKSKAYKAHLLTKEETQND